MIAKYLFGEKKISAPFSGVLLGVVAILGIPSPVHAVLEATTVWPATSEVPADAPLRIDLTETPTLANHGRIVVFRAADRTEVASLDLAAPEFTNEYGGRVLRYQPVLIEGNHVTIRLHTHALRDDETYFVRVEPGVFKDAAGREWPGISDEARWRFRTRRAPAVPPDRLVVAADGSSSFCTVQGAVDAVPPDRLAFTTIYIRRGVYDGLVRVPVGKNGLRLEGEDRHGVMLVGINNDRLNPGVAARALVGVEADDCRLENLTVRNLTPSGGSQAEALHVRGDRVVLRQADFHSFQDTLHLDGRVYAEGCGVEGSVDFIWGSGSAFFEQCEIHNVRGGYLVQARNPPGKPGYIFDRCHLTGTPGDPPMFLARVESNRFPGSQVVFLNCTMDEHIRPEGWLVTGDRAGELNFAEFASTGVDGKPLDVSRRLAGSRQLAAVAATPLENPGAVLGGYGRWDPRAPESQAALRVFDVKEAGATGDGTTQDAVGIQKALDLAGKAGGGIVRVPAGTYLTRPLFLRAHVTLHLDDGATLRATDVPADYGIDDKAPGGKIVGFINATNLVDVSISGRGSIDGAGQRWWEAFRGTKAAGQPEARRPRLVCFTGCRGVTVEGVTLKNSPTFHLVPAECEDVAIRGVTITAPPDSPNTDGIDPAASRRITIADCRIDTGDDNIAIKSGRVDPAHPGAACADLFIANCTFLHGHGMSIGSETLGGVSNVLIQNCTFENTITGFRMKSPRGRGGSVHNVRISDVQMTNVTTAINVNCYYPKMPTEDAPKPMAADTPVFRGIEIVNLKATGSREAGMIVGLPESPIADVTMENVHVAAKTGFDIRNVASLRMTDVEILPAESGAKGE